MNQKSILSGELSDRLWKSKSARFSAARRLKKANTLSNYAISLLSVHIILVTLYSNYNLSEHETNLLDFVTICLSILLLVFSLIESFMQYGLRSSQYDSCGKKIDKLLKKCEFIKDDPLLSDNDKFLKYKSIQKKYNKIIDLHANHEAIDYEYFKATNRIREYEPNIKIYFRNLFTLDLLALKRSLIKLRYNHLVHIHYYTVIFIVLFTMIYFLTRKIIS